MIYVTATPVPANPLAYDPEDTKQYLARWRSMVRANHLAIFSSGSESLWHGRRRAFTVVCLTLCFALLLGRVNPFAAADRPPSPA